MVNPCTMPKVAVITQKYCIFFGESVWGNLSAWCVKGALQISQVSRCDIEIQVWMQSKCTLAMEPAHWHTEMSSPGS